MGALTRYINRVFLARLAVVLFAITTLALLFDLLEVGADVIARDGSVRALVRYGALRVPGITADVLAVAALLASILTAGDLLRHRELVAIWNLGVSPFQLMRHLLPAGLLLITAQYGLDDLAVPWAMQRLHAWGVGDREAQGPSKGQDGIVWLRSGPDVVRFSITPTAGDRLADLTIFRRDGDGRLIARLDASSAQAEAGGWVLFDAIERRVGAAAPVATARRFWSGTIDVRGASLMMRDPRQLSQRQLAQIIANRGFGIGPTLRHETWLHGRFAGLLVPFLMSLLPLALARFRRTGASARIVGAGLGIGFAFFVLESVMLSFGEAGWVAPWAAAWAPPLGLTLLLVGTTLVGRTSG